MFTSIFGQFSVYNKNCQVYDVNTCIMPKRWVFNGEIVYLIYVNENGGVRRDIVITATDLQYSRADVTYGATEASLLSLSWWSWLTAGRIRQRMG
jgi:hypothetical protein